MKSPRSAASLARQAGPGGKLRSGRFAVWFAQISRTLAQQMLVHARRELGLNLAEYRTLSLLFEYPSASIKDIAAGANLDKAQIIRAVRTMTRRGLVIHTVDRRDRRLRVVKLTAAGRALAAKSLPFAVERQERMERALTPADLRAAWRVLTILGQETLAMLAEETQPPGERRRDRARRGA